MRSITHSTLGAANMNPSHWFPTLGNLHAGHLALIDAAKKHYTRTIVYCFVNPLQFAAHEDFDNYPRTLEADIQALKQREVDLVFLPTAEQLNLVQHNQQCQLHIPGLSDILCGRTRPKFLTGVMTILAKFFNIIRPDAAFFGEKDYQQLLCVKKMVSDLMIPITIHAVATVRETDGLAMSSRNNYLSAQARDRAPLLYTTLQAIQAQLQQGRREYSLLIAEGVERLTQAGFKLTT